MEDVIFFRSLSRRGRMRAIPKRLTLSARRYESIGSARLTFAYGLIAALYAMGAPLRLLAAIYRRTCTGSV